MATLNKLQDSLFTIDKKRPSNLFVEQPFKKKLF